MASVLPNRGWLSASTTLAGATSLVVMGPFCKDSTVIRVVFHATADLTVLCRFAATWGASSVATVEGLRAGTSLIQRGFGTTNTVPGLPFMALEASPVLFWVPVGILVQRDAEYIIAAVTVGAGSGSVHWSASAELVGVVR